MYTCCIFDQIELIVVSKTRRVGSRPEQHDTSGVKLQVEGRRPPARRDVKVDDADAFGPRAPCSVQSLTLNP